MTITCQRGHENVDGSFFCEVCGEVLSTDSAVYKILRVCRHCSSVNQPDAERCTLCNTMLDNPAQQQAAPAGDTATPANVPPGSHAAGHPQLVVISDQATFAIMGSDDIIIGRADPTSNLYPDIDLTAHGGEDGGVSRVHVRLRYEAGHYAIEDQNSINYTFLNKQRLEPFVPTVLKHGDELRLGRVLLRFELYSN